MRLHRPHPTPASVVHGREWGYALPEEGAGVLWTEFLYDGAAHRHDVAPLLAAKLRELAAWFEHQTVWRFYGSSLLVVYEGDPTAPPAVEVMWIDFAHASPAGGVVDAGCALGLRTLLRLLEGPPSSAG